MNLKKLVSVSFLQKLIFRSAAQFEDEQHDVLAMQDAAAVPDRISVLCRMSIGVYSTHSEPYRRVCVRVLTLGKVGKLEDNSAPAVNFDSLLIMWFRIVITPDRHCLCCVFVVGPTIIVCSSARMLSY